MSYHFPTPPLIIKKTTGEGLEPVYYLLSALSAVLIAVMVVANGELTRAYDMYSATVIIHIVGFFLVSGIVVIKKEKLFGYRRLPLSAFFGGAIGVASTLFINHAFGRISVSAIIALTLLGQSISALVVDQFGLFDMPVKKLNMGNLIGLLFTVFGILQLLSGLEFRPLPIIFSFLTGVFLLLSRSFNAQLAGRTSVMVSTWYNYGVGLVVSIIVALIAGGNGLLRLLAKISPAVWIYWGGVIGVFVVALSNAATSKIPAFQMTLILFAGQMFAGIGLDVMLSHSFSQSNLVGGVFVTLGLFVSLWLERSKEIREDGTGKLKNKREPFR